MNKGQIRTHFKAVLNRSDITDALADTFIDQGIARVQRTLRLPSMEKAHTYTFTASTDHVFLPNDYLEGIDFHSDSHALVKLPAGEMLDMKKTGGTGSPHFFTREGGKVLLYPVPSSGTLTVNYYAQFPELVSDSDTNNLVGIGSDLVIYAALTYAADYFLDERAPLFDGKYAQFLAEIQGQADDAELAGTLQAIRPMTNY